MMDPVLFVEKSALASFNYCIEKMVLTNYCSLSIHLMQFSSSHKVT